MDLKLPFARLVLQIQASLGSQFERHPSTLTLIAAKHDFIQHLTKYYHIHPYSIYYHTFESFK